ncbi:restriction endonuclease [Pseudoalteromonas carrageenovora]|uniref:restriction endonuclease n=1 Tax=Pseudoalteromonas carrageenovora TaxID=227 RepID=UPI0026E17182|nr:restriction endonuclease [Pseudoalteromonas carrageenovora]MDO6835291.1 restriction endonuclease [Pseudoalteromonas carrageenovora]
MRIIDAIEHVLKAHNRPMTHMEIYDAIVQKRLFSFGAKDPSSVVRSKLRKHCLGLDFPSASPVKLFVISNEGTTNQKPLYGLITKHKLDVLAEKNESVNNSEFLVEEIIHRSYKQHLTNLKKQLLNMIKSENPAFFETLVVDLLLKMGYGWNDTTSGKTLGGAGDEGIDGIISEDKLGLEKIYIQAKRYSSIKVPPREIRDFIGAMVLKGARKGVFFTTSKFSAQACRHAKEAQGMTITLVDGEFLSELLVQHKMGIAAIQKYTVYEVDKNFFTED